MIDFAAFPGTTSVTVHRNSSTVDDLGDATQDTGSTITVDHALFEPQQFVERTDSRSPGVTSTAKFYLPIPLTLDADDELVANGLTWRVVGGSSVWGDATEVPVERVSDV